jgi:hypothetical protein
MHDNPAGAPPPLPALLDELDRVRLDLQIATRERTINEVRAHITSEEAEQHRVQRQISDRVGELRREVERLTAEVGRLDARLERLTFARRPLSDRELDDEEHSERAEEAAFWAGWRQQREERRNGNGYHGAVLNHRPNGNKDIMLRQLYRALARLVHPDLARDAAERARREGVMRLANAAHEAGDADQLRRLLLIWSKPEAGAYVRDLGALRARLADRDVEIGELKRQLQALKGSFLGRMLRRPRHELERHIKQEEERLRREIATLRLRRRRLLSAVEERRREITEVPGS